MSATDETPHHLGHRQRLRQRFLDGGTEALPDYEMLELLLFLSIPRQDVKPLAKKLLARFGGFAAVLNADIASLTEVEGVKESTASMLKTVEAAGRRLAKTEIFDRPVINSWERLVDYCRVNLAHLPRERLHLLFLDRKNAVIAGETQGIGTVDHAPIYPREVARRALELNATAVIMVHNHVKRKFAPRPISYESPQYSGKHRVSKFRAGKMTFEPGKFDGRTSCRKPRALTYRKPPRNAKKQLLTPYYPLPTPLPATTPTFSDVWRRSLLLGC